jgi:hypothetical protein
MPVKTVGHFAQSQSVAGGQGVQGNLQPPSLDQVAGSDGRRAGFVVNQAQAAGGVLVNPVNKTPQPELVAVTLDQQGRLIPHAKDLFLGQRGAVLGGFGQGDQGIGHDLLQLAPLHLPQGGRTETIDTRGFVKNLLGYTRQKGQQVLGVGLCSGLALDLFQDFVVHAAQDEYVIAFRRRPA